jgi:uncharacterized membrane protein
MKARGSLLAGASMGAGIAYFLDPTRGARRRARIRDAVMHSAVLTRRAIGTAGRDVLHRTYGTAASVRGLVRRAAVDDAVLVERVRAKLGRYVSHAHAVEVTSLDGVVTLRGPILSHEADTLVRVVGRVDSVCDVNDQLERHEQPENIPALQGGRAPAGRRLDVLQTNWAPATRVLVGGAGAALAVAATLRRGTGGVLGTLVGGSLLARAATNLPLNRLFGVGSRRRAVDVQKTILVNASVSEVYAFWSLYENFPRFMSRVFEVRSSDRRPMQSHWRVAGPAGTVVEFEAEITRAIPNRMIAWKTLPGSPVAHAGIVRFDPEPDGRTRVHIRMSYNPPAGWFGHGIATVFGVDPKSSMDADLARMKTLIETGRAPHDAAQRAPAGTTAWRRK